MHGLLRSQGVQVSQSRLAAFLERVAPIQYAPRHHETNRMIKPLPYRARYFGEKLNLDQNEKCVMFGVTHVVAIDGYSWKIVGFITIPKRMQVSYTICYSDHYYIHRVSGSKSALTMALNLLSSSLPSSICHSTDRIGVTIQFCRVSLARTIELTESGLKLINELIILLSMY